MTPEEWAAVITTVVSQRRLIADAIRAAVAEEREACAVLVEDFPHDSPAVGRELAEAIRARGKT